MPDAMPTIDPRGHLMYAIFDRTYMDPTTCAPHAIVSTREAAGRWIAREGMDVRRVGAADWADAEERGEMVLSYVVCPVWARLKRADA